MDIQDRIRDTGIGATTIKKVDHNPSMRPNETDPESEKRWYNEATHWRVYLRNPRNGATMQVTYSMGSGHEGRMPTVAEVLDSVASDAAIFEDVRNEYDLADEFGMTASKAHKLYRALSYQARKLQGFLGDQYNAFLYETDRL